MFVFSIADNEHACVLSVTIHTFHRCKPTIQTTSTNTVFKTYIKRHMYTVFVCLKHYEQNIVLKQLRYMYHLQHNVC